MKAALIRRTGPPDVIEIGDIPRPEPGPTEVLVKVGDHVKREDGLITLETDKATMDVPAAEHGVIEELTAAVGDKVSSGDIIGTIQIEVGDTVVVPMMSRWEPTVSAEAMAAMRCGSISKSTNDTSRLRPSRRWPMTRCSTTKRSHRRSGTTASIRIKRIP